MVRGDRGCGRDWLWWSGSATAPAAAAAAPLVYVAMGDSFAAGSLVLPAKEVLTCARSAVNYASLIAAAAEAREVP